MSVKRYKVELSQVVEVIAEDDGAAFHEAARKASPIMYAKILDVVEVE